MYFFGMLLLEAVYNHSLSALAFIITLPLGALLLLDTYLSRYHLCIGDMQVLAICFVIALLIGALSAVQEARTVPDEVRNRQNK